MTWSLTYVVMWLQHRQCLVLFLPLTFFSACATQEVAPELLAQARESGQKSRRAFSHLQRFVVGWNAYRDPKSQLYPERTSSQRWTYANAGADLYPFLVLASRITDPELYEGPMRATLEAEKRLCQRPDGLPDDWDFKKGAFLRQETPLARRVFGISEYLKDGLVPVVEWIGPSPWFERLQGLAAHLLAHQPTPSENLEVAGEMLQVFTRLYCATRDERYFQAALRIARAYLLERDLSVSKNLRLRDHGCEILGGLGEFYVVCRKLRRELAVPLRAPLYRLLDRVLEVGRNDDGLFYNRVNAATGQVLDKRLSDTWGYVYDSYYGVYLVDGVARYRDEVRRVLGNLPKYRDYAWEGKSMDGYADSIESALVLLNREPVDAARQWVETEIEIMFKGQKDSGTIEGWWGDGNFGRTTQMYALYHTAGIYPVPWRQDLELGAVVDGDRLLVSIRGDEPWQGRLVFDRPRHRAHLRLPLNYPRINEFPEWYPIDRARLYLVGSQKVVGADLCSGLEVEVQDQIHVLVRPVGS